MPRGQTLRLTPAAAAELCRQAAVAGTPGMMHLDLLAGSCEQWVIRLRAGHLSGSPVARADGITLYAPTQQQDLLAGLQLDYRGDLSGAGFVMRAAEGIRSCACGASFTPLKGGGPLGK